MFLQCDIVIYNSENISMISHNVPLFFKYLPLILSIIGSFIAFVIYFLGRNSIAQSFVKGSPKFYKFLKNKWYFDDIYHNIIVIPYRKLSKILWKEVDIRIIDDLGPNGFARFSKNVSMLLSEFKMVIYIVMLL